MAQDISDSFLKRLAFPHYPLMHVRVKFRFLVVWYRQLARMLAPQKQIPVSVPLQITDRFEVTAEQYRNNRWVWVEHFFDEGFYTEFLRSWPPRSFFEPPRRIIKSYDVGFKWDRGERPPEYLASFPYMEALFTYLQSDTWCVRLQKYIGTDKKISCNSFLANMTYPSSCIIPHRDTPLPNHTTPFLNMIFFIDGTGGGDSGELLLSHDRNQEQVFFSPSTLKNACLIYDTEGMFYHGFPPVARGKERWAITASFSPEYQS